MTEPLHWIAKNKMVCMEPKCVTEYQSMVKMMDCEAALKLYDNITRKEYFAIPMMERPDWEFLPFHCACHNIAFGKTSFPCDKCGMWVCQDCAYDPDSESTDTVCLSCRGG